MQSHDGALHLLPALPDVWPSGSVSGLRARGGFEIETMEWTGQRLSKLVVKSNLGGNLRLRSAVALKMARGALAVAEGLNSNPFYQTPSIKAPLVSPAAKLNPLDLPEWYLYDLETQPGQSYTFVSE